ncbi:MAG: ArsR family transcriptional regulator [Propionibacteriales bacterium]|nr:ArsR family transcriptional regulator [Propionibacteriales bacterium]
MGVVKTPVVSTRTPRRESSRAEAGDAPTRERVAQAILESGPSTVAALAEELELTPAAVRRHLDQMLEDGTVTAREQRTYGHRGRGRPAKVFALTDSGHDTFYQAYDDLAVSAMRYLRDQAGPEAVQEFARRRVAELEERYAPAVKAAKPEDRAQILAEALTHDGYAASVAAAQHGDQLCQHHCPVAHVAEEFPQLCEAETEVFARLLGRHVQRLATIAHGDGVCTTHVPDPTRGPAPSTPTGRKDPS